MQNVKASIKLLSTIGGDVTFRVLQRRDGEIGRGNREDIVAVGREGVAYGS